MTSGCLAALFGSNPADDDTPDAALREPHIESAAYERAVATFLENSIRREGQLLQRHNMT